ncbi:S-adenosyl-L-methionine-dependent tRNA 4-demethylwyosine synthase TYW1-like [Anolis carolinensis]|uniref:S-adenosyl-L-methionine-dependent tRNA 4-demethylwyosine synthase TYW1-like n=1 Tax=Anolis carolinensis TaxID=28377 RepID=UPI002F2B4538
MELPMEGLDGLYGSLGFLWLNRFYLYSGAAFGFGLWVCLQLILGKSPKQKHGKEIEELPKSPVFQKEEKNQTIGVKIFYGSQTGTAKRFALKLSEAVASLDLPSIAIDMKDFDPEDALAEEARGGTVCVFVVSTFTDGQPPESAAWFCKWLQEAANDFRVGKHFLRGLRFAVFGLGDSAYRENYNAVGRHVDRWLWLLGAQRVLPLCRGDADPSRGSLGSEFEAWEARLLSRLKALRKKDGGGVKSGTKKREKKPQKEATQDPPADPLESSGEGEEGQDAHPVTDVEDLGPAMRRMKKAQEEGEEAGEPREMITPVLREALTKQGYRLIGSHSGVKLCRWTKSMLRGRGGCYKHTFYGIESHRCMEATPSLACANKCVFCWRHHTNPVGTEWRWKTDDPEVIFKEALENHLGLIRQFKGAPGVLEDRLWGALRPGHCALSLVGEPILYPHINAFLGLLHRHRISSFLVTNAQFPHQLRGLDPVTQLYVSVDGATKESLKRIDRPLFKDFWPRFRESLAALAQKKQRTVYRLTLVKAWNVDELKAYADLVALGTPDFIEVKGVTYCGAGGLTLANVPWHEEVLRFAQELATLLPDYEVASEHKHSNCLLIAHNKFKVGGAWHTWIDFGRFQDLVQSGGPFSACDYMAPTPPWAVFGDPRRGFDPQETHFQRKDKAKSLAGC